MLSRGTMPRVLHWRHCSLRGPVHERFADLRMSSQVLQELSVAMNQASSKGSRGRKRRISSHTADGFTLATLLPSWSSPQCLQVVGRRTYELPSTAGHSTNCWAFPNIPGYPNPACCQVNKLIDLQLVQEILVKMWLGQDASIPGPCPTTRACWNTQDSNKEKSASRHSPRCALNSSESENVRNRYQRESA